MEIPHLKDEAVAEKNWVMTLHGAGNCLGCGAWTLEFSITGAEPNEAESVARDMQMNECGYGTKEEHLVCYILLQGAFVTSFSAVAG